MSKFTVQSDLETSDNYVPAGDYYHLGAVTVNDQDYLLISDEPEANSDSLNFLLSYEDIQNLDVA